jgi:hypothetical protein
MKPVDRILTLSLILSPAITLLSSVLYALRGWDDGTAAVLHILGGIAGLPLVVRLTSWLDRTPGLAAAGFVIGFLGGAGVIGYGFNTIAVSLGGLDLIDASGPAVLLKVLGLCWPLALVVWGIGLVRAGRVPVLLGAGIVVAAVIFPVSRIANIGWLAVVVDLLLLACLAVPAVRAPEGNRKPVAAL